MAIYVWVDEIAPTPIDKAWIYKNDELWLVSVSSNWNTWYTISLYNLWNFQWGNNYSFIANPDPQDWADYWYNDMFLNWTVNWWDVFDNSWYWPSNPLETSVYYQCLNHTMHYKYYSCRNLWWWETNTDEAKRWPCASWRHVPSLTDMQDFFWVFEDLGICEYSYDSNRKRYYWSETYNVPDVYFATLLGNLNLWDGFMTCHWPNVWWGSYDLPYRYAPDLSYWYVTLQVWNTCRTDVIRPFKNTPVVPDSTRTVLYQVEE